MAGRADSSPKAHVHDDGESQASESQASQSTEGKERTLQELYEKIGFGRFQIELYCIAGLAFMADSMEVNAIGFLQREALHVWNVDGYATNMLGVVVFVGELLGCGIWGPVSDKYGRKLVFVISAGLLVVFGILSATAPNFYMLVGWRFLVGIGIGGIVAPYDCLLESVAEEHSGLLGYAIQMWWSLGTVFSSWVAAYTLPNEDGWRLFLAMLALPLLLALFGAFVMEESPAWLLDTGREDEALEVLQRAAKKNGRDISQYTIVPYRREIEPSMSDVLKPTYMFRTTVLSALWAFGMFGYYGATLSNETLFGQSDGEFDYRSILFVASGEFAGMVVLLTMYRYMSGMTLLGASYGLASVSALLLATIFLAEKSSLTQLVSVLAFIMRIGVFAGSCVCWIVTPNSYPTYIRGTAHCVLFGMGRIGGLLAMTIPTSLDLGVQMLIFFGANATCCVVALCVGVYMESQGMCGMMHQDRCAASPRKRRSSFEKSMKDDVGRVASEESKLRAGALPYYGSDTVTTTTTTTVTRIAQK